MGVRGLRASCQLTMPLSLFRADGPPPDALVRAPLMAGVTPHEYNRVRRLLFNSGISDLFADRTGAFFAAKAIVWGQTDLSNG